MHWQILPYPPGMVSREKEIAMIAVSKSSLWHLPHEERQKVRALAPAFQRTLDMMREDPYAAPGLLKLMPDDMFLLAQALFEHNIINLHPAQSYGPCTDTRSYDYDWRLAYINDEHALRTRIKRNKKHPRAYLATQPGFACPLCNPRPGLTWVRSLADLHVAGGSIENTACYLFDGVKL